jgi:tRNA threonylcarbamoyladenosine biosynthesis protein TsaE
VIYITHSAEETIALGEKIGRSLPSNTVVCFFGDLAAGKTTFIKGLVLGATLASEDLVNSPTFVYLNIYEGEKTVYHFDLYRLQDSDEFFAMGFQEFFCANGICCIEWAERIELALPPQILRIDLEHYGIDCRKISIT